MPFIDPSDRRQGAIRRRLLRCTSCLCGGIGLWLLQSPLDAQAQQQAQQRGTQQAQGFDFGAFGSINETFTTNAGVQSGGNSTSDLVSTAIVGARASLFTPKLRLALDASASYDKYLERSDLDGFRPRLNGTADVEAIRDTLFFGARASIANRANRRGVATPATNRTFGGDQSTNIRYDLDARVQHTIGRLAQAAITGRFSGTTFSNTDVGTNVTSPGNDQIAEGQISIGNPQGGNSRFWWQITGRVVEQIERDFSLYSGTGTVGFVLFRGFSPYVVGGYDEVDAFDVANNRSGPYYAAGFRWQPGQRMSASAQVGERYGDISGQASLQFLITQRLSLTATYSEGIATQQLDLIGGASGVGGLRGFQINNTGSIVDQIGGSATGSLGSRGLDLVNDTAKIRRFLLGLFGSPTDDWDVGVNAFVTERQFDIDNTSELVAGINAQVNRKLSNRGGVSSWFYYDNSIESRTAANDNNRISGGLGAFFNINSVLTASAQYSARKQNLAAGNVLEHTVSLRLTATFGSGASGGNIGRGGGFGGGSGGGFNRGGFGGRN